MFFDSLLQRKLASLLRPWLSQEPEFKVNLGCFSCTVMAKHLCFDPAILNRLIGDGDGEEVRVVLKSVTIDEVCVRVAYFSAPAFTVEVRGIDVTLSPERRTRRRVYKRVDESLDEYLEKRKQKTLAQIDPEGTVLHDIMKMAMATTTMKERVKNSITNLVLAHFCLHSDEARVSVEFPLSDDIVSWQCSIRDFNAESSHKDIGCFLGGVIGLVFLPFREISYNLEASGLEIGGVKKGHSNRIIYCVDPHIGVKLKDLHLVSFALSVPEMSFSFSPSLVQIIIAFSNIFYVEHKHIRSGRLLWKIARSKVHNVLTPPEYLLYKMVLVAVLWLRLVKEYQDFLALVGYSEKGMKMLNGNFPRRAKRHWGVISEIEKDLPAEALASARGVARYRVALKEISETSLHSPFNGFGRLFFPLAVIWGVVLQIFAVIMSIFVPYKTSQETLSSQPGMVAEVSESRLCFFLSFGKISAVISSSDAIGAPVNKISKLRNRNPYRDQFSLGCTAGEILYIFEEGICQQRISFSAGFLEVISAPPSGGSGLANDSSVSGVLEGSSKGRGNGSETIILSESALMCTHSAKGEAASAAIPFLNQMSAEIELLQERLNSRFQEMEAHYDTSPWVLCDIQTSKFSPGIKGPDSGFLKCNLLLGKLNVALGHSSLFAIATLMGELDQAVSQFEGPDGALFQERPARTFQDSLKMNWPCRLKSVVKQRAMRLSKILPNKHVELRAVVAGPCIKVSLSNEELSSNGVEENVTDGLEADGINLTINVHDSDFAIWSMAQSASVEPQTMGVPESEFVELEESIITEFQAELNRATYASKGEISLCYLLTIGGLDAYFEDSVENCMLQFLTLKPITAQGNSLRVYVNSFGGSAVTSSLSLSGAMTGVTGLFYMDELCVIFQAIERLISTASRAGSIYSGLGISYNYPVTVDHDTPLTEPGSDEAAIEFQTDEGETQNLGSAFFVVSASFELAPFDIILNNSRDRADKEGFSMIFDSCNSRQLGFVELPDSGIWLSIEKARLGVSVQGMKADMNADFHGFRAILFRYNSLIDNVDKTEVENTVGQSVDCLHEIFLSGCTFTLWLDGLNDSEALSGTDGATSDVNPRGSPSDSLPLTIKGLSPESVQGNGFDYDASVSVPSPWLLTKITIGEVFMGMYSTRDHLRKVHPVDEMHISFSIGGNFQSICLGIQGGFIFIESMALSRITLCLTSYLQFMGNFSYRKYPHIKSAENDRAVSNESLARPDNFREPSQRETHLAHPVKWELLEALSMKLSQCSLVLLTTDESGIIKEIVARVDFSIKLWLENRKRKFSADLSQFTILSQIIDVVTGETEVNIQFPHFSSIGSSSESLWLNHEDSAAAFLCSENSSILSEDACCSRPPNPVETFSADNSASLSSQADARHGNYILERLAIFVSAEEPLLRDEDCEEDIIRGWIGSGSVSGLNITISLSEIQMLMANVESLSEITAKRTANDTDERNWTSINQEPQKDLEAAMPDGAIVAIQDVHQHMYVTVENIGNKYKVAGAVHHSLAGERALFRVKWQKQRRWNSVVSWFSLLSLYAKSESGDPLRLNYCASSAFVDISSDKDNASALWKFVSCTRGSYEDDVDLEPLNHLFKNTFYLVNKKNDCGTAFIDGAFEFVKKPGNPFKFKVLHSLDGHNVSNHVGTTPCVTLTIEEVSFTIAHELSDPKDRFPLLQAYVKPTEVTIQVLPDKTRVMSTFRTIFHYFDVHRVLWRELVHPFETSIYCRLLFPSESEMSNSGVHSNLYVGMKELNLSLTERSLDILLYVVGKLDLAGPFAVKSSAILANCCKVENQTELNLLCHFYDAQTARVSRRQSAFFFLRAHQPLEESYVTISLEIPGVSSTNSIDVPLSRTRTFAWRTRIKSLQDPRTGPGPFIVFDISRTDEEGLSISVSPLLRICNETGFPVELRIQRPEQMEADSASVLLKEGETVDDCRAAFDAIKLFGGPKKALLSLGVGNFVFSFKPDIKAIETGSSQSHSVEWSENLKGGKAVRLSGVIDKFSYKVRKAFSAQSSSYSFSTTSCSLQCGNAHLVNMHFLVQSIGRDVPIIQPKNNPESRNSTIALQEQKEIFLLPTVQISNLLDSDVDVLLSETEIPPANGFENINQAAISSGMTVNLYANPAIIYFTLTLKMFGSSCKAVNCGQWLKKLSNKKDGIQFLDIDLEFCSGKYFACLRLARGERGILEAIIFTQYSLRNDTDLPLFCAVSHLKPSPRDVAERLATTISPHLGSFLPPGSVRSWFMKSTKVCVKLLDEETSESILDLDALSGLAEMSFTKIEQPGVKHLIKLGITLGPLSSKIDVPSRMVCIVSRYVISNESSGQILVRQCFIQDDLERTVGINSKQKTALLLRAGSRDKQDISVFDKVLRKHRLSDDDASIFVQFKPNEAGLDWSGPVCVAALGRFFLKFKRFSDTPVQQSDLISREYDTTWEFAAVHVIKEASTFVLRFQRPPDTGLPYRIENHLNDASITYYQKDTFVPETLAPGDHVDYVWDDLTRPRKLVVKINGFHMLREISLDKLRPWKRFFRVRHQRDLPSDLPMHGNIGDQTITSTIQTNGIDVTKIGYEVYANGPTRVLRISDAARTGKRGGVFQSCKKTQFRISYFAIHLLEYSKKDLPTDGDANDLSTLVPFIVLRLENISLDAIFIDQRKYNQIGVQALSIDEKWSGAPFASMLRRHVTSSSATDDCILFIVFVLYPTSSDVREVKYSSIVLQPIDLNLDEETMMKIVPFWRKSLSTNTRSQQYYFDHFEIHPIKITASFLPDDSYSSYSSGEEALRSLLHSVIKVPAIKNLVVELNGVLVTHALVTTKELLLRCAQHYSWYAMRAIYIAKGSPLLPPAFASVFDDLASSSLDAFFDPSSSLFNVRGLTLGTFKLISKCVETRGFSGTKRYFGDLNKTLRNAGSNILFAALTEISDSMLKGAESSGLNGMVTGFHHGILKIAMEPSVLGAAFMEGGPDRKITLDRSPGVDELYIEGYLQAMLDTVYQQEYLRVKVIENQVILKNLPPNSALIGEIMDRVKEFLASKALLKGDFSNRSRPLRRFRGENEWRIGPTILTLCEHLFVSFAIRTLRRQTDNTVGKLKLKEKWAAQKKPLDPDGAKEKFIWRWGIGRFMLSAMVAYIDGRLCRNIPHPIARRIVSGFLLSFLDNKESN